MIVARVPASTANLGPGFDALGMALSITAEIGVGEPPEESAAAVDERHPAMSAFAYSGGEGRVWVRSSIPVGRGLGFSAVMRVGGLLAAAAQRNPTAIDRLAVLAAAIDLEGHADNAAASLFGGVVATAGGAVVPVRLAIEPSVVVWIPAMATSTRRSRATLPSTVSFGDAVFNVSRTALLVAALAAGDVDGVAHGDRGPPAPGPALRRVRPVAHGAGRGAGGRRVGRLAVGERTGGGAAVRVRPMPGGSPPR